MSPPVRRQNSCFSFFARVKYKKKGNKGNEHTVCINLEKASYREKTFAEGISIRTRETNLDSEIIMADNGAEFSPVDDYFERHSALANSQRWRNSC